MKPILALLVILQISSVRLHSQTTTNVANGVMAMVNESVITYQQIQDFMREFMPSVLSRFRNQPEELQKQVLKLRTEGLESMIDRRLVIDEFKTSGGLVPDRYLEDEIRSRIRSRFGDRVSLTRELQAKGWTYEDYRERVREETVYDYMRRTKLSNEKILISPKKIEDYYQTNQTEFGVGEAVRLRILTLGKLPGDDNAAKKALAEEIYGKIKAGASFAELAASYSEDSYAKDGGDRKEMLESKTLRDEFREVAMRLPLKQSSGVIETPDGFYLLMVEQRQIAHMRPMAEVRDEIEKTLTLQERNRLERRWIERLRKKAFITYF
jgi:peptidyl-prolyl cis-trans isomerase SurA